MIGLPEPQLAKVKTVPADLPITITVRMDHAQMVLQGLGQYPFNNVSGLMTDLQNQIDTQVMRYLSPPQATDVPPPSEEPPLLDEEDAPQS